jgi:hypothetical protein
VNGGLTRLAEGAQVSGRRGCQLEGLSDRIIRTIAGERLVARLEGRRVDGTVLGNRRPGAQQELGGVDDAGDVAPVASALILGGPCATPHQDYTTERIGESHEKWPRT